MYHFFGVQLFLCGTHGIYFYLHSTFFLSTEQCAWAIISLKEFKSWVTRISFALLYGKNRIICCQIFCDLLLKSAFERNFNVMQLILVKIKWHIKWKYSIQKFHDICFSYYVKIKNNELTAFHAIHFMQYSIGSWLSRWMWYATNICYDRFWWCCLHILFLILLMALHSKCLHS